MKRILPYAISALVLMFMGGMFLTIHDLNKHVIAQEKDIEALLSCVKAQLEANKSQGAFNKAQNELNEAQGRLNRKFADVLLQEKPMIVPPQKWPPMAPYTPEAR